MADNILPFKAKQAEPDPMRSLHGPVRCLHCEHKWVAVVPVGVIEGLECPECRLLKGVVELLTAPDTVFRCACGCDLYYITPEGCMCLKCGSFAEGF